MPSTSMMHLNCHVVAAGQHPGAWRTQADPRSVFRSDYYESIARIAERGTFDALFLSDALAVHGHAHGPMQMLDPFIVADRMLAVTERIGCICTASTSFTHPFNLARTVLSLDHLSGGRIGWNAVTSYNPAAARNFGEAEMPDTDERYARAGEFIDVVRALWDSWGEGALIADPVSGVFADPARVHEIGHRGRFFQVAGPLNVPRSPQPQGRPVLVQAGASQAGQELAARHADVVFTSQTCLPDARRFYMQLKAHATAIGRDPGSLKIMPGLFPIIGSTLEEARRRKEQLDALRAVDADRAMLARQLGVDADALELDSALPYALIERISGPAISKGFTGEIIKVARAGNLTVRELILQNFGMHRMLVGTPEMLVADLAEWFLGGAADGFNLNFDVFPDGLEIVVEHAIPLLRKRGLFREAYAGHTLGAHLGLG